MSGAIPTRRSGTLARQHGPLIGDRHVHRIDEGDGRAATRIIAAADHRVVDEIGLAEASRVRMAAGKAAASWFSGSLISVRRSIGAGCSRNRMEVFWFFLSKKNRKSFFLQKEAKLVVPQNGCNRRSI